MMRRTAAVNQIRGLLLERGITLRKGRFHVDAALLGILEDATIKLSGAARSLLAQLKLELDQLAAHLEDADALCRRPHRRTKSVDAWMLFPVSVRLQQPQSLQPSGTERLFAKPRVRSVGWVSSARALNRRQAKLLGISKRGNSYLRRLFVQCARAVLQFRQKQSSGLSARISL